MNEDTVSGIARAKRLRLSPQKARLVVNQIRGKPVGEAVNILTFSPKKAARLVLKVLESAIANAEHNEGADVDRLTVSEVYVDAGPTMKRVRFRAKFSADRILKRTCHVTVVVSSKS